MDHALSLAARGLGNVWPNPAVGCVIVRDNIIVGRGWTQPGGRPHAERMALDQAGLRARGATAYVTLEPCAHFGQTLPCANALIDGGIVRVVTALTDPDPRTSGKGHAALRAAGVVVDENIRAGQAAMLQRGFLKRFSDGLPLVTLKLATTLDGRIATKGGESKWITGPRARADVQMLRLSHDAIMVGGGTARADLPQLNLRGVGKRRQPVRIIVTKNPLPSLIAEGVDHGPLWQVSGAPRSFLTDLASRGITRILCEGGGQLAASLLQDDLVDDLVLYSAGVAFGSDGRPAVGQLRIEKLASATRFALDDHRRIGPDLRQIWRRQPEIC